ncbi:MAG TPA: IPT/TIG domain-containing protein [Bryobacteraceae bacterium]|nr:IPT/TIG domain-containing protein [Bryobacteraceae bacterium]
MKCFSAFFFCAATVFAAGFTNGQAARAVIGQRTFTDQDQNSSDTILGAASGIAYAGDTLFVADSNRVSAAPENHRVLLFKNLSSMLPAPAAQLQDTRKCPVCIGQATVVLGQPDFTTTTENIPATQYDLRTPTAVASDGVHLVVADTDHNRILIWNSIPTVNNQPADLVVGQPNFTSASIPGANTPTAKSLRGPQGVWIQNGKLFVADTQNNRVLIYNRIPTSNGAAADVVLGQPNFTTATQPDLTQQKTDATASNLLNPVSVTSDGLRLYVSDLGFNRVLIWNTIPSSSGAPADVVIGQPDMNSSVPNNAWTADANNVETPVLCTANYGTDPAGHTIYPNTCNATISFPRFALSDGQRLFIADGGNDRVLVFNQVPTHNGASADYVIGEIGGDITQATDAADSLRTPMSLAWDGTDLFVSDSYNRRITVYSMAETAIPYTGVRNAASLEIFAGGIVTLSGTITQGDSVTVTICGNAPAGTSCISPSASVTSTSATGSTPAPGTTVTGTDYTYKIQKNDGFNEVVNGLVTAINAKSGDPNVIAVADLPTQTVVLTARQEGDNGNNVGYSTFVSANATIAASASGANLSGGGNAAQIAAGTLVTIQGSNLSSNTVSADPTQSPLPTTLGGTQVYFNGIAAPLLYVSPTQINAQIPWEVLDTTSINAYVRSVRNDGSIMVTTPVAVSIVTQNPGIFTHGPSGTDPRPGVVLHGSSSATGVISVDGSIQAGDVATVNIEDRSYSYTVQSSDTLDTVRDNLAAAINQDPKVTAAAASAFDRIIIKAKIPGPDGNGMAYSATSTAASGSSGAQISLTPFTTSLCCANVAYSPVTDTNPALPGEIIIVYATGLGVPQLNGTIQPLINTGFQYPLGSPQTSPVNFVSSLAGNKTANVLAATLKPGTVGLYEVWLQLNSDMPTDPLTQLYIAQDIYISNVVTFPVANPAPQ